MEQITGSVLNTIKDLEDMHVEVVKWAIRQYAPRIRRSWCKNLNANATRMSMVLVGGNRHE